MEGQTDTRTHTHTDYNNPHCTCAAENIPSQAYNLGHSDIGMLNLQDGDTAVILGTVKYNLSVLNKLVRAGADINLQNQVTLPMDTAADESLSYLSSIRKD